MGYLAFILCHIIFLAAWLQSLVAGWPPPLFPDVLLASSSDGDSAQRGGRPFAFHSLLSSLQALMYYVLHIRITMPYSWHRLPSLRRS